MDVTELQGYYHCEVWGATRRVRSNKALFTFVGKDPENNVAILSLSCHKVIAVNSQIKDLQFLFIAMVL